MGTLTTQVAQYSMDCSLLFYNLVQENLNLALNGAENFGHFFKIYASESQRQKTEARKRQRLKAKTVWEQCGLFAVLTIFIHSEVDHLPGALTQWLDDGGQSVSSTWLLETILGAAAGPKSTDAADRVRPADAATRTKLTTMESSSNRTGRWEKDRNSWPKERRLLIQLCCKWK